MGGGAIYVSASAANASAAPIVAPASTSVG
jgi:hypothetical protein